jgi:hypothetical protein
LDACGVAVQWVTQLATNVQKRAGGSITVYAASSPAAGGVVISNCDPSDPNATMAKSATNPCAPADGDTACIACLKAECCTEGLAWYDGSDPHGTEVVSCVDARCAAACPVAK